MPAVRVSRAQARKLGLPVAPRPHKYGARGCYYFEGRTHPLCPPQVVRRCALCSLRLEQPQRWYASRAEAAEALRLDRRLQAGQIRTWRRGTPILLEPGLRAQDSIAYVPDFVETLPSGAEQLVEVKGSLATITREFRLKLKLLRHRYPDVRIRIVDRRGEPLKV